MTVNASVSNGGEKITISVKGNFDFQIYDEFIDCYAGTEGAGKQYVVDLSDTEYLDSSALGMLLLLRKHAGGESSKIDITQASAEVKKILNVANFGKLFNI